jgi:hypothetical protein
MVTPTSYDALAGAIMRMEGYYPGTLAYKNNNPGNLIFVGQAGAVNDGGGFARFQTFDDGYNALVRQLKIYTDRGLTVSELTHKWAPACASSMCDGNNPVGYAANIAQWLGVSVDTPLSSVVMGSDSNGGGVGDENASDTGKDSVEWPSPWVIAGAVIAIYMASRD